MGGIILLLLGGRWLRSQQQNQATPTPPIARTLGGVDGCRRGPQFTTTLGLSGQAAVGTSFLGVKGLALFDPAGNNGQGSFYQHPSWDQAGYLGPWLYDRRGHIYTAPVPLVSLVDNPTEEQNKLYQVDTSSQEMREYLAFDWPLPPSGANPFGVVGLAYDCETESLYVTTLAGSTASQEVGRIYQVDLITGQIFDQREGVDAMGVAVFNGRDGKRLYYGLTRRPEVHSIALDAQGNFVGESRLEFVLTDDEGSGRIVPRRIRFTDGPTMSLNLIQFSYSLQVVAERQETLLTYSYDPFADSWSLISRQRVGG